jgi:hypothetical protein
MTKDPRQSQYDADRHTPYPHAIPGMSGILRLPPSSARSESPWTTILSETRL